MDYEIAGRTRVVGRDGRCDTDADSGPRRAPWRTWFRSWCRSALPPVSSKLPRRLRLGSGSRPLPHC